MSKKYLLNSRNTQDVDKSDSYLEECQISFNMLKLKIQ